MTQIILDGYFTESACKRIKRVMQGKSFMDFKVSYHKYMGSNVVTVSTERPNTTEMDLKDMFFHCALNAL